MERLTKRNKNDRAYFPECFNDPCNGLQCAKDDCEFLEKVCEKLAECEDKEEPKMFKTPGSHHRRCLKG